MDLLRQFVSSAGRLILGENRYRRYRAKALDYLSINKEKEYRQMRKRFFESGRDLEEYSSLCRTRLTHCVTVEEPLLLISQVARSGGTLLKRLFDSHPQCHVYPVELAMGIRSDVYEYKWPLLDNKDDPDIWLKSLIQLHVWRWLKEGFKYWPNSKEIHPFIFFPLLCERIFHKCVSEQEINSDRDIFNCYMTAFFNAWVDNQNLYTGAKKYVVAFAPEMGMETANIESFFRVYPDGYYISIVRDPMNWYASASSRWPDIYSEIDSSIENHWKRSTRSAIELWRRRPNHVLLVSFEGLISSPENTLRQLTDSLDIRYTNSMLVPTFNGQSIKANSSFGSDKVSINEAVLHRYKKVLSADEINHIKTQTSELYDEALRIAALDNCSAK
jgi:hypothetical protein